MRRIELPSGGLVDPAHEHGAEEEIFYVLAGQGLSWQDGLTFEIGAGDCIVHKAGGGVHTVHALLNAVGTDTVASRTHRRNDSG